jgi:hypothetical protein
MEFWQTFFQSSFDGLILCVELVFLMAPLLIGYELAKAYGVFERPIPGVGPVLTKLGLGPGALVPLLAGIFLGLMYGAGILIAMSREQGLDYRERLALAVFLVICHGVVEDTALFVLLGGSAVGMVLPRVLLAVLVCLWLARRGKNKAPGALTHGRSEAITEKQSLE